MKLNFRSNDSEGARWRAPVRQGLALALRRLHVLVSGVQVQLDDSNGPAPGVDKRCRVTARLHGGGEVVADVTARSWSESVKLAALQLRQRLLRRLRAEMARTLQPMPAPALALVPVRTATGRRR
jgi:hypothetical protein